MTTIIQSSVLRGVVAEPIGVRVSRYPTEGAHALQLISKDIPAAAMRETTIRVRGALLQVSAQIDGNFLVELQGDAAPPLERAYGGASAGLDLPIAVAVLCEAEKIPVPARAAFVGELDLGGALRYTRGLLAHLRLHAALGLQLVSREPAGAAMVPGDHLRIASSLGDVAAWLRGELKLVGAELGKPRALALHQPDLADIKGMARGKRALEICAAGQHNLLLVGRPGAGKTMLAQRLPGILPAMTAEEQLDVATIHDAVGFPGLDPVGRPFRAPHYSCSEAGLLGGGSPVRPGEVTLAHGGVLFLDELPEWRAPAIGALNSALRLSDGLIFRCGTHMPCRPLVVAASNPCPCGYAGAPNRTCLCSDAVKRSYRQRGVGLDFPLVVDLEAEVEVEAPRETSDTVRARVTAARKLLVGAPGWSVSRTIAALAGHREMSFEHVAEAASFAQEAKS